MRVEIKNEKYNRFLKIKELDIFIEHPEQANPSAESITRSIAEQASAEADKIEVKQIMTSRGSADSKGIIFIWDEKLVKKEVKTEPTKE